MIRDKMSASQTPMQEEDVALCQRVFEHICMARHIASNDEREELAIQILHFYQHGVKDQGVWSACCCKSGDGTLRRVCAVRRHL